MFTSKKAQYLNKDFDRISPITNIESLYYEQAEKNGDNYNIKRRAVAKHLPIRFDVSTIITKNLTVTNSVNYYSVDPGDYKDVSINIDYANIYLPNPENEDTGAKKFKYDLYHVDSSKELNLQTFLQYYAAIDYFNTSINDVNAYIDYTEDRIVDVCTCVDNTSSYAAEFIGNTSDGDTSYGYNYFQNNDPIDNKIYNLIYWPFEGFSSEYVNSSFIIKVQGINTENIKDYVSLDVAKKHISDTAADKWQFHYDISKNEITYLKDEYGNEGNFDFRNKYTYSSNLVYSIIGNWENVQNNKFFFEPLDSSVIFMYNTGAPYNFKNNEIYNSKNIIIGYNGDCANNIIYNCIGVNIAKGDCNKVYNSSNNLQYDGFELNSSLNINGDNNTIINCNDCSIDINGSNNILINLKNQNLTLGDNNIIICDASGCPVNQKTLNNDRLFLNQSSSTAIALDLSTYCTIFGGIDNDVSVYSDAYSTTNK